MNTIFDSILLNRIQIEAHSSQVQLDCIIYEEGVASESQLFLSTSSFNQLLNELSVRGIEIDFDQFDSVVISEEETIYCLDLTCEAPVFLPFYCIPREKMLLRA